MMISKIYMVIAPAHEPNSGDYDYPAIVSKEINKLGVECELITNKQQLLDRVEHTNQKAAFIHITNYTSMAGHTGSDFTVDLVKKVKQKGATYVFSIIEPIKVGNITIDLAYKALSVEYYNLADLVVTHTEYEDKYVAKELRIPDAKRRVIPIPQTVETINVNNPFRKFTHDSRHVFHFGIIRPRKGVEESLEFSRYLATHDPTRKIIMAGSINAMSNLQLIEAVFLEAYKKSETICEQIKKITVDTNKQMELRKATLFKENPEWEKKEQVDRDTYVKIGNFLQEIKMEGLKRLLDLNDVNKTKPELKNPNFEIYPNVSAEEIAKLSNECSYALYSYMEKGLSERLSGFTNAMAGGLKIYCNSGYDTGNLLKEAALKEASPCFILKHEFSDPTNPVSTINEDNYASVLKDIKKIESNQDLAEKTRESIKKMAELFSPSNVAKLFINLFK